MSLSVEADMALSIDGQAATLKGSGKTLRLTVTKARMLRSFIRVSLPQLPLVGGRTLAAKDIPGLLAKQGVTLEIADERGLLLLLGAGAQGRRYNIPGVGRFEHLALANVGAAARLVFGR